MKVRDGSQKWSKNSAAASGDYVDGVRAPRRSWEEATADSAENYAAGVQDAVSNGRFESGVREAGDSKYRKGVEEKGRTRYQQGVAVSTDEYKGGFAPFKSALEGLSLSPRGPKGQNYSRVQEVGEALRDVKNSR